MEKVNPHKNSVSNDNIESDSEKKTSKKKSKAKNYLLSGIFLLVLMTITFYVIFKDNSIVDIWAVLKTVKLSYALYGVIAMIGFIIFQGIGIGLSAECLQTKLTTWEMLQYSFVSFFYSGITPSAVGGQPMQFYHMCRDRLSPSKATLVLFITNMAYQMVIVILGLLMFFTKLNYIISVNRSIIILFFLGLSVNVFILLILFGVMFSESLLKRILIGSVSFLCRIKIIKNSEKALKSIENYLDEFRSGVELIKNNEKRFVLILLSTSAHFLLYHMIPFFVYRAFGFSATTCFNMVAISSVLYVAINLFPLPGSVGAAESGFVILFGPFFAKTILPAMLLSRFINFYTMILLSGAFSAYAQLRKPYNLSSEEHSIVQ